METKEGVKAIEKKLRKDKYFVLSCLVLEYTYQRARATHRWSLALLPSQVFFADAPTIHHLPPP